MCQIFVTKPHTDMGFFVALYINLTNMCNLVTRYTFSKLSNKFTEYTSYEIGNLSKAVPTFKELGDKTL